MAIEASSMRKWLVAAGLAVGVGIGAAGIANAATSTTTGPSGAAPSTTAPSGQQCHSNEDPAHEKNETPQREADENGCRGPFGHRGNGWHHDETPVTGANADKAKAAALKAVPGTVERVEQRSDGTYEVHVIKSDGTEVHVLVDKTFKVTGQESGGPRGDFRHGGWHHHSGAPESSNPWA